MNKIILTVILVLAFILTACGSTLPVNAAIQNATASQVPAAAQGSSAGQSANTGSLTSSSTDALPVEDQLLLGTFKLEGTSNAITAAQAQGLLPLWQQIQSLSPSMGPGSGNATQTQASGTPAVVAQTNNFTNQPQINALVKQIQATMTSAQLQAIAAMQLTQDSVMTIMQSHGINMGGPGAGSANGQQPPQGNPPSGNGQAAQGNPPSGNGQPATQGTPQAGNAPSNPPAGPSGQGTFVPPQFISTLLQLLQNRIDGTSSQTNPTSTGGNTTASNGGAPASNANSNSTSSTTSAAYCLTSGTASQTGQTYSADHSDESAVYVSNTGSLTLTDATITSTGNTSSSDNSSFVGLNAAVLAANGGTLSMSNSQVTSSGSGANGVFSTGNGSTVTLANDRITASGDGGHAVMATQGGTMNISDVDMSTSGASSSAIATDRGGGSITVTDGTVKTSGMNSAGIYSTGNISVTNTTFSSTGAEAAVIEGGNSITLNNASLTSSKSGKWGVMIYQSMSGDAQGTKGTFTMTGGSLAYTATDGPLFYVTNSTAVILLKGVTLNAASGTLVKAASGNWGNSGSNGGTVLLTADGQTLTGNLVADAISSVTLTLQKSSSLTGAINSDHSAKAANLSLDANSSWTVTADSYLAGFSDASGITGSTITNITGNGHTVYYNTSLSANSSLGGKTYSLNGGGTLKQINS
jgi:hypothetical protein